MEHRPLGKTGLSVPPLVFGTSCLGNLYEALSDETKLAIVREWFRAVDAPVVADSAGKYGAGLALEVIGDGLRSLGIAPERVLISNKLAWVRAPLRTPEPTFEPGVWKDLRHDAEQRISYEGILACWEQGCALLGAPYRPALASVHDPDEYLAAARTDAERRARWQNVLGAYRALHELKARGEVKAVGVGAKDWTVMRALAGEVALDWAMVACSLTLHHHPPELVSFMERLAASGVGIINSAVFHAGFLVGGSFYDYRRVSPDDPADAHLFAWRERFFGLCERHSVTPAEACVQFGLSGPGVASIALNTSKPDRVAENARLVDAQVPAAFWRACKDEGLISHAYGYVG